VSYLFLDGLYTCLQKKILDFKKKVQNILLLIFTSVALLVQKKQISISLNGSEGLLTTSFMFVTSWW